MLSSSLGKDFSICFSETFARGSLYRKIKSVCQQKINSPKKPCGFHTEASLWQDIEPLLTNKGSSFYRSPDETSRATLLVWL